MPRPEKVQAVEQIREQLDEARATFVTEYRGLTVAEQQQLRRNVKKAQGEYRVLKMSLARRAVEDMSLEGLIDLLAGPTALAFANDDPVPVAKALRDFASDHERLIIKGGILGGALLLPEQISRLAEIESREVLLAKIAGGVKAPWAKMARMLGAKVRDAASMFSQLLEKKEEQEPVSDEVAAEPVTEEAAAAEPAEAEETPAVEVEETPEAEEASEAEAEEAPEVEAEETPAAEGEEAPEAEAEKTSEAEVEEAEVEEAPEVEAEEAPAAKVEEAAEAEVSPVAEAETEVEAAPAVKVEDTTEAEVEETLDAGAEAAPAAEVEETPKAEVEDLQAEEAEEPKAAKPTPKKKAAPKAKAKKSTADKSDDTAEEE